MSSHVSLPGTAPAQYGVTEPQENCTSLIKPKHKSSWCVTLNHAAQVCSSSSANRQRQKPMDTATGLKKSRWGDGETLGEQNQQGEQTSLIQSTALLLFLTLPFSKLILENVCSRSSKIKHKRKTFVKAFSQQCRDSSPKPSSTLYLLDLQCAAQLSMKVFRCEITQKFHQCLCKEPRDMFTPLSDFPEVHSQ